MQHRRIAVLAGILALGLPAGVAAKGKPDHAGKKEGKGKSKPATYVFKGTWNGDGTVLVTGGNSRVRKQELKGTNVAFDLTNAKLRVADTSGDGVVDASDIVAGDKVVVQAKLPRDIANAVAPYAARKLVDQTHPAVEEQEEEAEAEPTPSPEPSPEATPES